MKSNRERDELYARHLADGKPSAEAYRLAGFTGSPANARRKKQNPEFKKLLAAAMDRREAVVQAAAAEMAKEVVLTRQWVLDQLVENVLRALQKQPADFDAEGKPISYRYDGSVVNTAAHLLGKELGMFVDRSERRQENLNINLTNEQLDQRIRELGAALGLDIRDGAGSRLLAGGAAAAPRSN